MRFTVSCPIDGTVEVSADDVTTVVVRSGSDVEVAFCCPVCGTPIAIRARVPPGLVGLLGDEWGDTQPAHSEAWVVRSGRPSPDADDALVAASVTRIDAYVEYFRRELACADTVESMLSFMDAGANL